MAARERLQMMQDATMENEENVPKIMEALSVLRVSGDYAKGLRKWRRAAQHEEAC